MEAFVKTGLQRAAWGQADPSRCLRVSQPRPGRVTVGVLKKGSTWRVTGPRNLKRNWKNPIQMRRGIRRNQK